MTQEEKAKAYDEALAKAKEVFQRGYYISGDIESIFPELKESENDKELSELLHQVVCSYINNPYILYSDRENVSEKVIPYVEKLEKQSEQKPAAWTEEDDMMIEETLYFLKEYQHSNRCKDENGMQNSVTCEKWLKNLKGRNT